MMLNNALNLSSVLMKLDGGPSYVYDIYMRKPVVITGGVASSSAPKELEFNSPKIILCCEIMGGKRYYLLGKETEEGKLKLSSFKTSLIELGYIETIADNLEWEPRAGEDFID